MAWKGGRPLAFLRSTTLPGGRRAESLVLTWDVAGSSAARTPAMVVMLVRFVEHVRRVIPRGWSANVETGQEVVLPDGRRERAPETPGFFRMPLSAVEAEAGEAVTAAAQFADVRECDFRAARPADTLDAFRMERVVKRSVEDPWAPLWIAVAVGAVMVAWGWKRRV